MGSLRSVKVLLVGTRGTIGFQSLLPFAWPGKQSSLTGTAHIVPHPKPRTVVPDAAWPCQGQNDMLSALGTRPAGVGLHECRWLLWT